MRRARLASAVVVPLLFTASATMHAAGTGMRGQGVLLSSSILRAHMHLRSGRGVHMLARPSGDSRRNPASLKVSELKAELARRGLAVSGVKSVLIDRLHNSKEGPAMPTEDPRPAASTLRKRPAADHNGPTVLIVESPAKVATIQKFLGPDFELLACSGHVRALPSKPGSVRPENEFEMSFELSQGAGRVMQAICRATRSASRVLLATDPDREGEAIAWHVWQLLLQRGALPEGLEVHRVTFGEITRSAVCAAIEAPRPIDIPLVRAQQARQAVDYLVGFTLSPVLWRKLPGCRSAGRVQSVALRLLVEREEEILRFLPQEYWRIQLGFGQVGSCGGTGSEAHPVLFSAEPTELNGERLQKLSLQSAAETEAAVATMLADSPWRVAQVRRSTRRITPPAPYNTASMQLDASSRLSVPVGVVMQLAQRLYEGLPVGGEQRALITYMRTDSHEMSNEALAAAREYIAAAFEPAEKWLPEEPRRFAERRKKNAQEAHEAIRPVDFNIEPASLVGVLPERELGLYELIWRRALASQMSPATHENLAITLKSADNVATARASTSRRLFAGFEAMLRPGEPDTEAADLPMTSALQSLSEGDELTLVKAEPSQHWTTPPARYSEGGLVKRLEQLGVGRPSTYAMIMRVLQERGYAELASRALRPLPRGQMLIALLVSQLERYVQYEYTAQLEEELDAIAGGDLDFTVFMSQWWREFQPAVGRVEAADTMALRDAVGDAMAWLLFPSLDSDNGKDPRRCPSCVDGRLIVKFSRFGPFVGCNSYPNCSYARTIGLSDEVDNGAAPPSGRALGEDVQTGLEVSLRYGPFGAYVQLGGNITRDEKERLPIPDATKMKVAQLKEELIKRDLPSDGRKADLIQRLLNAPDLRALLPKKRAALPAGINSEDIGLEEALKLLAFPAPLGVHPVLGGQIVVGYGRFGGYVRFDKLLNAGPTKTISEEETALEREEDEHVIASLPANVSVLNASLEQAIALIDRKMARSKRSSRARVSSSKRSTPVKAASPAKVRQTETKGAKAKPPSRRKLQSAKA